ncbi:hypothetical protein DFA_00608 [Cavenderia fasciculata]|uniref:Uncharacterized protein n=1 Tax=Cavenderia fasciculata TaxID=261658 RepID=F4PSV6_CACFS|nr:uncharacterized protein DFA_00608 [Cavenderia fasciculata]EGG20745.1 hypothetical protein DFA_00608 [Cavenderia fasciculata]|eukprot:XP_004358595.1 hypothetical protein DFA_00608 [Cavenderia fasciculata]
MWNSSKEIASLKCEIVKKDEEIAFLKRGMVKKEEEIQKLLDKNVFLQETIKNVSSRPINLYLKNIDFATSIPTQPYILDQTSPIAPSISFSNTYFNPTTPSPFQQPQHLPFQTQQQQQQQNVVISQPKKPLHQLNLIIVRGQVGIDSKTFTSIKSFLVSHLPPKHLNHHEELQINIYNVNDGDQPPNNINGVCLYMANFPTARIMMDEHEPAINLIKKQYPNCKIVLGIWLFGENSPPVAIQSNRIVDETVTFIYSTGNSIVSDKYYALETINKLLLSKATPPLTTN